MKKNKYINTVIKLIERSLSQEISPEAIAKANYVSLRQLYRDFYAYTGHSIKEYIRKRRISIACEKLKSSNIPLSIIADESGSKTQQAFHKQFKSIVGMTPFEYKQSNTYFYFHPYTVDEISIAVRIGMENIPTCMTTKYYDSCFTGIEDKAIASIGEYNGRVFGKNGVQIANRFCYEVMTETDSPTYEWQATTGNYASCVVNYTEREINEGWNYLYNIWLPTSMFEQASEEYFEEYLFRDGRPYKLKLYLPVKKRKAPQHISITKLSEMTFVVARERGKDAERKASARVIHLLLEYCPLLLLSAKQYYMSFNNDICECGIACGDEFRIPEGINLSIRRIPQGSYAMLADEETLKQIGNTKVNGGFHFFSAITGDMFSILYSKDKPCDSGVTNYFFVPQVVKKAYATFGYDCTYISNVQIQKDYHAVMNAIRRSIDKGIPVLAWGMGNVTMGDGNRYDPLPEGCLIGGYDENDLLYVNLYPGPERMTVDDDGYTAISNGLDTTKGLFFLGEPIEKPHMGDIYRRAIEAIPAFLTLPATDAYLFGKDAFYSWADTILEEERFIGKNDDQLNEICWDLHCSPYCNLCTSAAEAFIRAGAELYEIPLAIKLLPLYEQLTVLRQEIWALHGDFFPPMDKFRNREFRMMIADRLLQMGNICEDIVKAFD